MNPTEPDHDATSDDERADVQSDPARDDEDGSDWSTEGGATPEGPATATRDDAE
jgi:hypothetical protein